MYCPAIVGSSRDRFFDESPTAEGYNRKPWRLEVGPKLTPRRDRGFNGPNKDMYVCLFQMYINESFCMSGDNPLYHTDVP